jgi:hypothetical protein
VDSEGRIMHYHIGFAKGDEKKFEQEVRKLLDL